MKRFVSIDEAVEYLKAGGIPEKQARLAILSGEIPHVTMTEAVRKSHKDAQSPHRPRRGKNPDKKNGTEDRGL